MTRTKRHRSGYSMQRTIHERKRTDPNPMENRLRQALSMAKVKVIGYEYEVEEDEWHAWYDAAIDWNDQIVFIDIFRPVNKQVRDAQALKRDYCDRHGIPLIEVRPGAVVQMLAEFEYWRLVEGRHM